VVLSADKSKQISLVYAATRLNVNYRQIKRIWRGFKAHGAQGLIHQSRGKSSARALPLTLKERVINLYQHQHLGFGPTFASEKLLEYHNIKIQRPLPPKIVKKGYCSIAKRNAVCYAKTKSPWTTFNPGYFSKSKAQHNNI